MLGHKFQFPTRFVIGAVLYREKIYKKNCGCLYLGQMWAIEAMQVIPGGQTHISTHTQGEPCR